LAILALRHIPKRAEGKWKPALTRSRKIGIDFAGVVERIPPGERNFHVGDRIFGMARTHGAYAEYTVVAPGVNTEPLARIPDGVTDEQAAALPIAGITGLRSLELLVHRFLETDRMRGIHFSQYGL
jgi:NADPH:quinone reductase-like Zn-dependent oxidoreductase